MKVILQAYFLLTLFTSYSQSTQTLDINNVNATVANSPVFFVNSASNQPGYEIPAQSGKHTIYATSLWTGAEDASGQVYVSATTYSNDGWSSGPIAEAEHYNSGEYLDKYNAVWKVSREEVMDHIAQFQQSNYTVPNSILNWPGNGDVSMGIVEQLAPFYDNDGDGIYEPTEGDYPSFPGDQVAYAIINDEAQPDGTYMGIEVHLMFYQFDQTGYLSETTFLNTKIINRSNTNYYNFKQSIYNDFDIGGAIDDFIGSDPTRNMMYQYNSDFVDEGAYRVVGYEQTPPCQAVISLNRDISSANYFTNAAQYPYNDPSNELNFWNYMNGLWANGSPIQFGGTGHDGGVTTQFVFTGNPNEQTGWTEVNANNGVSNLGGDRRGVMTNTIGDLPSGASVCSDYAFIFNGDDTHLQNVQNVMNIADALQDLYNSNQLEYGCGGMFSANIAELTESDFNVYPNPTSGQINIDLKENMGPVIIEIRDMTGRLLHSEVTQSESTKIQLDIPEGIYNLSVISVANRVTKSIIVN